MKNSVQILRTHVKLDRAMDISNPLPAINLSRYHVPRRYCSLMALKSTPLYRRENPIEFYNVTSS